MYSMKKFKQILKEFRENSYRGGNEGGDDGDHEQHMIHLMQEMLKHPFKYATSDGHEVHWNNSLDAMHHIAGNLAKHDNAYGEHAVRYGEDSPQAMYHSDAGDKHAELYEALRTHIENHPKIHPTLRTYAKRVLDVQHDVNDRRWSHEENQQHLIDWSKGLRENSRHHLYDIDQEMKNSGPYLGYFLHKDEIE